MHKKIPLFLYFSIVPAWVLTGCSGSTSGPESLNDQEVKSVPHLIHAGKTTKTEIIKIFGHPAKTTTTTSNQEVWDYYFTHSRLTPSTRVLSFIFPITSVVMERSVNVKDRMLRIIFHENIVESYEVSEKKYTKTVNPLGVKTKSNF